MLACGTLQLHLLQFGQLAAAAIGDEVGRAATHAIIVCATVACRVVVVRTGALIWLRRWKHPWWGHQQQVSASTPLRPGRPLAAAQDSQGAVSMPATSVGLCMWLVVVAPVSLCIWAVSHSWLCSSPPLPCPVVSPPCVRWLAGPQVPVCAAGQDVLGGVCRRAAAQRRRQRVGRTQHSSARGTGAHTNTQGVWLGRPCPQACRQLLGAQPRPAEQLQPAAYEWVVIAPPL